MSSAGQVHVTQQTPGVFHTPQITAESGKIASNLLQKNHDSHHIFFNTAGFHNHIVHHLLAIYALGATPPQIQTGYDNNASYQLPQFNVEKRNVQSMSDPSQFSKFLGNEKYFSDYQIFFQQEIDAANGKWGDTIHKHLFSKTPQANDLLIRMLAGFYHPIIHLGYGVEFQQPAIIAEALAQAAVHNNWPGKFLNETTQKAREAQQQNKPTKSLVQILHEARANEKIRKSARWEDGNKVRDGVYKRALLETSDLCAQWRIENPDDQRELKHKTAEMINACAYFAGASQHFSHAKQIKFDFFHMHCMNASIFFSAFLDPINDTWLGNAERAQLLEYKAWTDMSMYISRAAPELFIDEIKNYKRKRPGDGWAELFQRVNVVGDDGHSAKLLRAIGNGHKVCTPLEAELGEDRMIIRGEQMWLNLAHMAIDSVENTDNRWIRNAGFEQAWDEYPARTDWANTNGVNGKH